ncbi:MAG: TonB-dependent receptor plug domain-containing protein, partial [Caulobacteraceae bacterium]|nr:TonB-dependent receptor plug domain-containing protein [Caulobacteraceae bacterium]
MMRFFLLAGSSAAALVLAGAAQADDAAQLALVTTVDPLTVIGTRTEKPLSEVPATVSVITAEEIEDQLAADVKDLFRYEPGVSVRASPARFGAALGTTGRDGNAGFNIRGLEGNRVLVQVDGVRTPDSFVFGAQAVGRGDYGDLDLLKSAEVLRGPASALYGSDGVAGAISFTTKDPEDFLKGRDFAGQAKGAYASADESWAGGLVAAGRSGDWSAFVAYTRREGHEQETQGTNASANTDRTVANPQDIASNAVLAKVVYDLSDANRFRLTYEHLDRDIDSVVLSGIAKPTGDPPALSSTAVIGLTAADTIKRDRISFDHLYEGDRAISKAFWNLYWQDAETEQFTAEDRN